MSLNKIVKNNLKEVKEVKRTRLTESKIVKGRLGIISESVNLHSKIQTTKFFNKLFLESRDLINMGITESVINEDLVTVLKGLMGDEDSRVTQMLKERLISYLESKLGMDGFEKTVLTQSIIELEDNDFPKIFTDKRFLPRNISDVFTREFKEKYLEGLTDTTKDAIMNQLDTDTFKRELEDKYTTALETLLSSIESNMDSKLSGIRDSVFS
jgi:hypothetical protein